MLLNNPKSLNLSSSRESIHNYYELMVLEQLQRASDRALSDPDFLADCACVALNHLPPRYVRHNVDMTFFLSPTEMEEMKDKVASAVNSAVKYVEDAENTHQEQSNN